MVTAVYRTTLCLVSGDVSANACLLISFLFIKNVLLLLIRENVKTTVAPCQILISGPTNYFKFCSTSMYSSAYSQQG